MSDRITQLTGIPGETGSSRLSPAARFLLQNRGAPRAPLRTPSDPLAPNSQSPAMQFLLSQRQRSILPAVEPQEPDPAQRPGLLGEFAAGAAAGTKRIARSDLPALAGITAKVFGADQIAQEMLELALEQEAEIEAEAPPKVAFEDVFDSPMNFARFAARTLGEQTPVIASIILTAGAGGIIANLVGRGALTAAQGAAGATRFAQGVGAFVGATGLETAATGKETFGATGEIHALKSYGAGMAKGALEMVVPLAFAKRFGLSPTAASGVLGKIFSKLDNISTRTGRAAAGAALGFGTEGATELLQEAVDIGVRDYVDENFDVLDPDTRMRLLESAFTGALVGTILGGVGGIAGGRSPSTETQLTEVQPGEGTGTLDPQSPPSIAPGEPIKRPSPTVVEGPSPVPTLEEPQFEPAAQPQFQPEPTPVDETPGVAQQVAVAAEPGQVREFLNPIEAQETLARNPGLKVFAVPEIALEGADTSVALRELPAEISPDTVENVDPAATQEGKTLAISFLQQASSFLRQANKLRFETRLNETPPTSRIQALEESAATVYSQAIELGARIRPQRGQGFVVASGQENVQAVEVRADAIGFDPAAFSPEGAITFEGTSPSPFKRKAGEGIIEASTKRHRIDESIQKTRDQRNFRIDERRFKEAGGTVSSIDYINWTDAISELGVFKLFDKAPSVEDFRTALEHSGLMRLEQDLTDTQLESLIKKIQKFRDTSTTASPRSGQERIHTKLAKDFVRRGLVLTSSTKDLGKGRIGEIDMFFSGPEAAFHASLREVPIVPNVYRRVHRHHTASAQDRIAMISKARTAQGKLYGEVDHKDGTVEVVYNNRDPNARPSQKLQRTVHKIKGLLSSMMRDFNMGDSRLVFVADSTLRSSTRGQFVGSPDGLGIIFLNTEVIENALEDMAAPTLAHEFGHFLVQSRFAHLPESQRRKIYAAYTRDMLKASNGLFRDSKEFFNFYRMVSTFETTPTEMTPGEAAAGGFDLDYQQSFDEWMAEHVSRWFTSNRQPLTMIERFLRGTAREIKKMIARVNKIFGEKVNLKPNEFVAEWLEAIRANESSMTANITHGDITSWERNAKILAPGTPDGAASEKVEIMMDKLQVPKETKQQVKAGMGRINWLMKWFYTIRQLAQLNPSVKGLKLYNELIDRWALTKAQVQTRADGTIKGWRNLSRKSQDALAQFIFEVDSMSYLKKDESPRLPTNNELLAIAKKYDLSEQAFEQYNRIRGDLLAFLERMENIAIRDIKESVTNTLIQQVRIAEIKKEFRAMRNRPYFPHSRFGDFSVVVKDKNGKTLFMEQFATRKEAQAAFPEIAEAYKDGFVRVDKIPEEAKPFRGLPPTLLAQMKNLPGLSQQQLNWIEQLSVDLAPTQSFRKRLTRRDNTPGFSLDAMRSYANYMWHGANYIARVEYQRPLQEAINSVHELASDPVGTAGLDVSKLREIGDFMQNHLDQVLNPAPDWAQLRSLAFMWWLGFSPASAVVNLTQNVMTTYPYLGSRFGDTKALGAMRRAIMDMQRIARGKHEKITDAQIKATARAVEKGVTDESYAQYLAATAEGSNLAALLPGDKFHRAQMMFSHYAAFLYQHSEKANRRIAFAAGWRLAMENPDAKHLAELKNDNELEYNSLISEGFSHPEAMAYLSARDAVWTTQYQYSAAARPRFLRGKKSVLFAFFSFLQNTLFFATHDKGRARFFLMMLFMGGMMGLPGAEDLNAIIRLIGRKMFGEDWDVEKEARKFITDLTDDDSIAPDLILHGASKVGFGVHHALDLVGIPAPEVDLSASVGLGRIIPGVEALGRPGADFDAVIADAGTSIAGAAYGIGVNLLRFLSDDELPFTDSKRYERALPRSVKALARGYRYLNEERERTRTGATLLEFDPSDPDHLSEIVGQAMGFTPTRLSRVWDRQRMEVETVAFWTTRRGMLMRQFDMALEADDPQALRDMQAAIARFNNEVIYPSYRITVRELKNSRRERERRRRMVESGIPANRRDRPLVRDIRRLFPEAPPFPNEPNVTDTEVMGTKR